MVREGSNNEPTRPLPAISHIPKPLEELMSLRLKLRPLAAAAALACVSLSAHATNGYFLPGFGVQSMSMGGTGIASGTDSLSAGTNPANLSWVGMRGDFDFILFNPNRYAKVGPSVYGFGTPNNQYEKSGDSLFEFPNLGFAMPLTDRLSVGVAFLANGGMNTTYNPNFYGNYASNASRPPNSTIGVDLMQLLIPLSVSFKPTETQSVGFSLIPAVQRFRARGLENFVSFGLSSDPQHVTGQGAQLSYGFGARVGWIGHFVDNKVDLGATYSTKIYMSKLGGYKGLFAGGGSFDIPANYGVGLALHPTKQWTLAFDITRIMYADVPAVGNLGPGYNNTNPNILTMSNFVNPVCANSPYCLGLPDGLGFGWKNQTVYKFGLAYQLNQQWTVKAGYNYGHSPIPNNQITFNELAPATVERHYSAGFTWKSPSSPLEVSGFYMRVPSHEQCGTNLQVVGEACFKMDQNYLGVSLGWDLGGGN